MPATRFLKNALTLVLSVVLCLGSAEIVLRAFTHGDTYLDPTKAAFWQFRQQLNPAGNLVARDLVLDDVLGWRMKPGYESRGIRHNSAGFRGAEEFSMRPSKFRVLTIGDSMTYGLGVSDDETFSAHLQRLTGDEVINAGVNSYGVDQALLMWERYGIAYAPDVVVLGYFVDDFHRNGLSMREWRKPHFAYNAGTGRIELRTPVESRLLPAGTPAGVLAGSRLFQALDWAWHKTRTKLGLVADQDMLRKARLSSMILARLKESVVQNNARLLVVFFGHRQDGNVANAWIESSLMQSCRAVGVDCVNMAEAFRQVDYSAEFYGTNSHFSAFGHQFIANEIAKSLGAGR